MLDEQLRSGDSHPQVREVLNQSVPLEPINTYEAWIGLQEGTQREGGGWGAGPLRDLGALAGSAEAREHSFRAERNAPVLAPYDRFGHRVDAVESDPSWHWLLRQGVEHGIHSLPWTDPGPGAHVVRAGMYMLWHNVNTGVMCPISMNYSAVPALRAAAPDLAAEWEPRLVSRDFGAYSQIGVVMTERQGGSDVRTNTTTAVPAGDGTYELWGHKWFCSHPTCEHFLVLARTPGGLSCFLVERGPGMEFQRLKDKLGTRALASSEVEYRGARARMVGEEGRGIPVIIAMINFTRLECLLGGTASIRRGVLEAVHHCRRREAFGTPLADLPLMRNVLADLQLESEAATVAALRVARAYDDDEPAFRRFATAVMKFGVCKRAVDHAGEALECLGGNGYVEDSGLPQHFRDSGLPSIWDGSGNVVALDVLRAMETDPEALPAFLAECELGAGADRRLDAHLARVRETTGALLGGDDTGRAQRLAEAQFTARRTVEDLALALQGSLLVRHAPAPVADAFCATRLGGEGGRSYGTLPAGADASAILARAVPA
ncbi:DNA alkylation response protein [Baekduia soli]|uniref:DNA alkylation response protein n=1 Tax=Baekduia soli TaxID=496014 RepID=A0A5B8U740_9ACTN|nr:acyl-CoA dehydrogenase family protein [Baekduia soli]QEC48735.1 DNA alkylation response protein [Baekduia soli]